MKRFFLIVVVLLAVLVAALSVFLMTFDADRFRPQLITQLEHALGRPVQLQHLSLGWRNGIAIELHGFTIPDALSEAGPAAVGAGEPLLAMESASALVRLGPLLHKEVDISSVVLLRPRVHVVRDAAGRINLLGLAAAASPAAASSPQAAGSPVALHITSLRVQDGSLHWSDAQPGMPPELWMKQLQVAVQPLEPGRPMDLELAGALQRDAPNVRLRGRVTPPTAADAGSVERLKLSVDQLPLEQVLPAVGGGGSQIRGALTASLDGSATTLDPAQLARAVSGAGTVHVDGLTVTKLNVLRSVFDQLSVVPGLVQKLEERLPPEYRQKLAAPDTQFAPIDLSAEVGDGAITFHDVELRTDGFRLIGTGSVGLDGSAAIRSTLRIDAALSGAIITSVEELQALANSEGELVVPVMVQSSGGRVSVLPDLNYVASKVLTTKVEDAIDKFLQKALKRATPEGEAPPSP